MRRRYFAAIVVLLASSLLGGCVPPGIACPAIGYVYTGPIVVEIDAELVRDGTVAACFGTDCEVAELSAVEDGRWAIPQEPPYSAQDTIGIDPGAGVRIVITDSAGSVLRDEWAEIPYSSESNGLCPGPVTFEPVVLD